MDAILPSTELKPAHFEFSCPPLFVQITYKHNWSLAVLSVYLTSDSLFQCLPYIWLYYFSQIKSPTKVSKTPPPSVKPPDLWIHQPNNLELQKMERSQRSESSASVATSTLRRGSRGSADQTDDQGSTLDRRRNSFVGKCTVAVSEKYTANKQYNYTTISKSTQKWKVGAWQWLSIDKQSTLWPQGSTHLCSISILLSFYLFAV